MSPDGKMLAEIDALISDGKIKTVSDRVFPMYQVAAAYDQLATGCGDGKIVFTLP